MSGGTDVAALPPAAPLPSPAGRSSLVGGWTAATGAGATCRIQLSSAPALDLYRASASGCASGDLARVNAWDYRKERSTSGINPGERSPPASAAASAALGRHRQIEPPLTLSR